LADIESFFQFALVGLENRQDGFKFVQRLFGSVRAASKVSQPFDPLPLTHNHHAAVKHALNGGLQQRISHRVFHSIERLTQRPANQSQKGRFRKSACGYLGSEGLSFVALIGPICTLCPLYEVRQLGHLGGDPLFVIWTFRRCASLNLLGFAQSVVRQLGQYDSITQWSVPHARKIILLPLPAGPSIARLRSRCSRRAKANASSRT
jgi:hypothetical protein